MFRCIVGWKIEFVQMNILGTKNTKGKIGYYAKTQEQVSTAHCHQIGLLFHGWVPFTKLKLPFWSQDQSVSWLGSHLGFKLENLPLLHKSRASNFFLWHFGAKCSYVDTLSVYASVPVSMRLSVDPSIGRQILFHSKLKKRSVQYHLILLTALSWWSLELLRFWWLCFA